MAVLLAAWWLPTMATLLWISSSAKYQMLRDTEQGIRSATETGDTYQQPEELALTLLVLFGPLAQLMLYVFVLTEAEDWQPKELSRNARKQLRREARKQKATIKIKPPRRRRRKRKNDPSS
ncbi:MAG: hypothetical protein CMM07_01850 [Rhodopirellula sp.]|nr:hypothetical protein [Rhodopirellula sp.]